MDTWTQDIGSGVVDRTPYNEGDVFAVPLRDGGYAPGVIARADGKGVVVGYFFAKRFQSVPPISALGDLSPLDHVLVQRFGDIGLIQGTWPRLGALPEWRRESWPIPAFGRHDKLTDSYVRVEYADNDPNSRPREVPISEEQFEQLANDGLAGFQFVEDRLTRLLSAGDSD